MAQNAEFLAAVLGLSMCFAFISFRSRVNKGKHGVVQKFFAFVFLLYPAGTLHFHFHFLNSFFTFLSSLNSDGDHN